MPQSDLFRVGAFPKITQQPHFSSLSLVQPFPIHSSTSASPERLEDISKRATRPQATGTAPLKKLVAVGALVARRNQNPFNSRSPFRRSLKWPFLSTTGLIRQFRCQSCCLSIRYFFLDRFVSCAVSPTYFSRLLAFK